MARSAGSLLHDRRGSVALIAAIMAPVMIILMVIAIEVTSWSLTKMETQRLADAVAWAGALQYIATNNAETATLSAVQLAEINGVGGSTAPEWDSTNLTTTDGFTTVNVVQGNTGGSPTTLTAIVTQSVDKSMSLTLSGNNAPLMISAVSTMQITSTGVGPPNCLSALGGGGPDGNSISMSFSSQVFGNDCFIRANGGIALSDSAILNVAGTYAIGPITTSGSSYVAGGETTITTPVTDPYAKYSPLVKAFSSLSSGGTNETLLSSNQATIGPGTYSNITVAQSAILTMQPGLYIVNGDVNLSNSSQMQGTGVTIVSSGSLTVTGSAIVALIPPDTNATTGGIPGFVFASRSNAFSGFGGSSSLPDGGIIYYPNGNITLSGSFVSGESGCTQFLANGIIMSQSAKITTDCTNVAAKNNAQSSMPSIVLIK